MLRTYEGTLKDGRIEWSDEEPTAKQPLRVHVTVLEDEDNDKDRGRRMVEALSRLAESGAFEEIEDPSEWQREVRRERPLPGREQP